MQTIDLTRLDAGEPLPDETPAMVEARRAMEVCNACRYCEGFCAVFPAMELRREFAEGDLNYLANLCHSCRGCYYACQYAPPHEFGINVPRVLAEVRAESYAKYAWPGPLATLYRRNGLVMALAMAAGVAGVLLLAMLLQRHAVLFAPQPVVPGQGFYNVVPYGVMVSVASVTFLFSMLALGIGFARFWTDTGGKAMELTQGRPLWQAFRDAATLRYLGGGGQGCNDRDESFSSQRRCWHHLMAYGFLLCFASTSTATVYDHVLGWAAPYSFWSLPVLLGTAGGLWPRRGHRRAVLAQAGGRPRTAGRQAARCGCGPAAGAAADRGYRAAAAVGARDGCDGQRARHPSRPGAGLVRDHAVLQVRPWPVPHRCPDPPRHRAAGGQRPEAGRGDAGQQGALKPTRPCPSLFGREVLCATG